MFAGAIADRRWELRIAHQLPKLHLRHAERRLVSDRFNVIDLPQIR
jgi:hypothetical protein